MCVALDRHAVRTSESQIRNLQTLCLVIYQEILRLQVSAVACTILEAVLAVLLRSELCTQSSRSSVLFQRYNEGVSPVHDAMLMAVCYALHELVHEALQADREQLRMDACASKICQCW